jgi:hypothetical protein
MDAEVIAWKVWLGELASFYTDDIRDIGKIVRDTVPGVMVKIQKHAMTKAEWDVLEDIKPESKDEAPIQGS